MAAGRVVRALQSSVGGWRPDCVSGIQRTQVCQTPLGSMVATKMSRPLANCGRESALSTWTRRSRRNVRLR